MVCTGPAGWWLELVPELLHDGRAHEGALGPARRELAVSGERAERAEELLAAEGRAGLPAHPRLAVASVPHRVHGSGGDVHAVAGAERAGWRPGGARAEVASYGSIRPLRIA
jgi:hypothetical protein